MKKSVRAICLILALLLFASFALGSGSEKASENKGENAAATGTNDKAKESGEAEFKQSEANVKVTTDSIGTDYVEVWWTVTNTGKVNLYLESGSADVENSNGSLQDTVSMVSAYPEVIKPGETGYYYERTLYDGEATSGLKAVPHADVEKASVDCIRYAVSDVSIKEETYFGAKVIGKVENNTDKAAETSVNVVALLFDSNDKLIGCEYTFISGDLAAGDKKAFECSSLRTDLKASDIAKYTVYAYPTQYNF